MTDDQVADIYAITRNSFSGGQREIQLQSYPFHMTAEDMAKFRLDPNIDFWKNLKDGSDHFEVTKNEPSVLVCGKHYVFDATTKDEVRGNEPCPALKHDQIRSKRWSRKRKKKTRRRWPNWLRLVSSRSIWFMLTAAKTLLSPAIRT